MRLFVPTCLFAFAVLAGAVAPSAYASGLGVESRTQEQIKDYAIAIDVMGSHEVEYAVEPDLSFPYENAGELTDGCKESALSTLNFFRYIAGVDANVVLNDKMGKAAQAGAYVSMLNHKLAHNPGQPEGLSDEIYKFGRVGAGASNLSWGAGTLNRSLFFYMYDSDSSNISVLGHRRWMLNPRMSMTGFGAAGSYYALYAFDSSGAGRQTRVAWPAQQMPVDWFARTEAWSIAIGKKLDASSVQVTLTRESDGRTWNFKPGEDSDPSGEKYFGISNDGYGLKGCIIFRPDDIKGYEDGDVFDVKITGVDSEPIEYHVSFFTAFPVTSIELDETELSLNVGESTYINAQAEPSYSVDCDKIAWSSSNEEVATVDEDGQVTAVKAGRATITASVDGVSATTEVTVTKVAAKDSKAITKSKIVKLKATAVGKRKVRLSWKVKGNADIDEYWVFKRAKKKSGFRICARTKKKSVVIKKGLKSGKRYYFKVRGYNKVGGRYIPSKTSKIKSVKVR